MMTLISESESEPMMDIHGLNVEMVSLMEIYYRAIYLMEI